jgi:hypothetical protein
MPSNQLLLILRAATGQISSSAMGGSGNLLMDGDDVALTCSRVVGVWVVGDALSLFITRSCFGPQLQFSVGAGGRDGVIVRRVDGEKAKVTGFLMKIAVCEWRCSYIE